MVSTSSLLIKLFSEIFHGCKSLVLPWNPITPKFFSLENWWKLALNITTSNRLTEPPPKPIGGVWWVVAWVKCVAGSRKYHAPVSPPLSAGNYVSGSLSWGLLVGRGDIYFQLYPGGRYHLDHVGAWARRKRPTPKIKCIRYRKTGKLLKL